MLVGYAGLSRRSAISASKWVMNCSTLLGPRFVRDTLPVRLGGLAPDLSRIKSTAPHETINKHFIEWTAHETEIETAGYLAHLQIELALWQRQLPDR